MLCLCIEVFDLEKIGSIEVFDLERKTWRGERERERDSSKHHMGQKHIKGPDQKLQVGWVSTPL